MKNKEQLKKAFERFPKVDVLYTDGERIFVHPVQGAKKVTRTEVAEADTKTKADADTKAKAANKAKNPKTKSEQ